ncbi:MAG TPA: DUF2953 domain-containing protein [Methanosarcinaceae archaeon]|nr:DUF2953 domain-containing protein [Methanosarcinaceae archaeon]
MLPVIYAALALIVLFIGLVVFAAFDVTIDVKIKMARVSRHITIKWMGVSYKFRNGNGNSAKQKDKQAKSKKVKTKKKTKTSSIGISSWFRITRTIQKPVIRFIKDILGVVKFRKISCDLTFGFSDPADTGILSGLLYGLKGLFAKRCSVFDFSIDPQFQDEIFDLHVFTNIRFRISSLIFAVFRFVTNRKVLGAAWLVFRQRRASKPNMF